MLEGLRRWSQSWSAKMLLGVLALSMVAFFGFDRLFLGGGDPVVATVGSQKIRTRQVRRLLSQRLQMIQARLGREMTVAEIQQSQVIFSVLRECISQALLDLEADRLGLVVSDAMLKKALMGTSFFQDDEGCFSQAKFQRFLRERGWEERTFLTMQREAMRRQQVMRTLGCLVYVPYVLPEMNVLTEHQERLGAVMPLSPARVAVSEPSRQEVETFFKDHAAQFEKPAQCGFSALSISPDLWKKESLSDTDMRKKMYDLMEVVEDHLYGGMSLEDVSKKFGLSVVRVPLFSKEGPWPSVLTKRFQGDDGKALVDYVFSEDVKRRPHVKRLSERTLAVVDVQDVRPSFVPPLEDIRPEVVKAWKVSQKRVQLKRYGEEMAQALMKKEGKKGSFALLPAVTLSSEKMQVPPKVQTALFEMKPGQIKVSEMRDGSLCLVKLLEIRQPADGVIQKHIASQTTTVRDMLKEDFALAFLSSLRAHYHVHVHQEALARAVS